MLMVNIGDDINKYGTFVVTCSVCHIPSLHPFLLYDLKIVEIISQNSYGEIPW